MDSRCECNGGLLALLELDMSNKFLEVTKVALFFGIAIGMATPAFADACSEQGGHSGNGTTTRGQNNSSVTGNIGSSGYHYEIWYQGGNNSMTYYNDGTFSAEWNGSNDFLARVGFKYNSTQTHDQIGYFTADYKFTKSGSAAYSYIGIYGWTQNPLVEYYIVDDWFTKPSTSYLGTKKGEITVDGDTYDIYTYTRVNQPSIEGTSTFPQFFSVRRNARQCGHIDITAHFKKWDEVGLKLGKMYEVKVLAEAGGGATGKIDFTYFKMSNKGSPSGSDEQVQVAPKSSSSRRTVSSASVHRSSSSHRSHRSSSSAAVPVSSSRNFWPDRVPSSSSVAVLVPVSSSSVASSSAAIGIIPVYSSIANEAVVVDAIPESVQMQENASKCQVFDLQGRLLGDVEIAKGAKLKDALLAKFGKTGVYMVKDGGKVKTVSVTP
ncbi:MAG: glycoside hydrolase family 11 protein [Fibrobacter sp.]|nr:glycoside hydrolase family 11 protein [Fibrobacter sp.]